ncbi:MAG: HlyD family efflux transporter periplasmic adaptor subunit [Acidobacteria bacterium]|nr:HlyD family efflux transporter periplasmic adaptor subunit [Acidobacteriota bacterium]
MRKAALLLLLALSCSRKHDARAYITVSGRIEGDEVDLAFKIAGRISEITVREGDAVKQGAILARLAGNQEEIRLKEAQARLAGAVARLEQSKLAVATVERRLAVTRIQEDQAKADAQPRVAQAEAQLAALKAELAGARAEEAIVLADAERYAKLAGKGAIARQIAEQYESKAKTAHEAAESLRKKIAAAESFVHVSEASLKNPFIRAAEAEITRSQIAETRAGVKLAETEVAAAQAAVEHAQSDLAEINIVAPIEGWVVTRSAEPGRVVVPGQVVLTIVDPGSLYLRGFIPVAQSDLIKVGQPASVVLPSDSTLSAEVIRIDPQAMFTPENTYFKEERVRQVVGVKLRLKGNPGTAKIGMPADATIKTL